MKKYMTKFFFYHQARDKVNAMNMNKLPTKYYQFTLSLIASSQKDYSNNEKWRCSDNDDGCENAIITMVWFNDERYFNIFYF